MKIFKSILFVFVLLAATANIAYAQTASTTDTPATTQTETVTIKVKGVGCANDLKSIAGNVEKLDGVSSCKAVKMGATSSFEVVYNPSLVEEKAIHAAIEDTAGCSNPKDRPYKVKL